MKDPKELKVVRVFWLDAHSEETMSEEDLNNLLKSEGSILAPYWAYGCLIGETEEAIVLAQGVLPKDERLEFDENVFKKVITIPKSKIKEIWEVGAWLKIEFSKEFTGFQIMSKPEPSS